MVDHEFSSELSISSLEAFVKHSLHVLIRVGARPGPVRVEVEGCLTQASCPDLIGILDHGTQLAGCTHIWVDLFSLDHMELSAVAALKDYARRRQAADANCPRISIYAPTMSRPCAVQVGAFSTTRPRYRPGALSGGPR